MRRVISINIKEQRGKIFFCLYFSYESKGVDKFYFWELTFFAQVGEKFINFVFGGLCRRFFTAWKFLSFGNNWQNSCSEKVLFSNASILWDTVLSYYAFHFVRSFSMLY